MESVWKAMVGMENKIGRGYLRVPVFTSERVPAEGYKQNGFYRNNHALPNDL
jgi:hypothetical protein